MFIPHGRLRHACRHRLGGGRRRGAHHGRQGIWQIGGIDHLGGDRKQILVAARIEEGHLGAAPDRGLAQPMREQRHLLAQIRADDHRSLERIDIGNVDPEAGVGTLVLLGAKIQLPQAVVDVAGAEAAGDSREQTHLLERRHGSGQETEGARAVRLGDALQAFGRRGQRNLPIHGLECAADAHHRPQCAIR